MQLLRVELQTLVSPASVGPLVAPVADTEGEGGQGQDGADDPRHLARGEGGPQGQGEGGGVEEVGISEEIYIELSSHHLHLTSDTSQPWTLRRRCHHSGLWSDSCRNKA